MARASSALVLAAALVTRGAALAVPGAEVRLEFLRDTLIVYTAVDTTDLAGATGTTAYGRGMPASERVRVSVSDLAAPASPSLVSYHTVPRQREGRPRLHEISVRLPEN